MNNLFEELLKMDPAMRRALENIRLGRATPQDAEAVESGYYSDTHVPTMGNAKAYKDFLSRNNNKGIHVHADLNDFGQINKLHGEKHGDAAIKKFGKIASEISRSLGGKSFRNGGDEFKFWFHEPEHAHAFARQLRTKLEAHPKVRGTHNLAASIGIGFNRDHAESSLLEAKKQMGPTVNGKRQNLHAVGDAPTVIHSKTHEPAPAGWKRSNGKVKAMGGHNSGAQRGDSLAPKGLKFHNPLAKNDGGEPNVVNQPIPSPDHPVFHGKRYGIITADDPHVPPATQGGNHALEHELRNKGLRFERITGKYTKPHITENSYIVHGIDRDTLFDLGHRFGQEAVIHSDKGSHEYMYSNGNKIGQVHHGEGHVLHPDEPELYYSTLSHGGQNHHFTLNIDFDHLHPLRGYEHLQGTHVPTENPNLAAG